MRELDLLHHIYSRNAALPPRVTIPPGDDMGAVAIGGASVLVTVDQIADGVHFHLASTPLEKIARKAITRNLSDVAAMGAIPSAAVVAGCLPRGFGEARANQLSDLMSAVALSYDCPLIGGDISIWDHPLLLSVTILAEPRGVEPVLRDGAKPGDVVYVTGALGGSLIELDEPHGYVHHLDFEPRLRPARSLAADPSLRPRCMMDLSDGLGMDLPRICRMGAGGEVGAVIDVASLPLSRGAMIAAQRSGRPAWQHALGDGEDYELLLVVSPETAGRLPRAIEGVALTRIGEITRGPGVTLRLPDGKSMSMTDMGWQHHD